MMDFRKGYNYFNVPSWIDRRVEDARQTYIGDSYSHWSGIYSPSISLRLSNFAQDNWNIQFNGEYIEYTLKTMVD